MIPQSFIQDLLARVDIVDLIERYLPLKKSGANYFACCPFHSEKSASFSVSPSKQFYHCFGCGAHGNAIGFLMEYSGLGYVDAIKELAKQIGLTVPEERGPRPQEHVRHHALTDTLARAAHFYREQLRQHPQAIAYLKGRGLSGEIAQTYGIGYAPGGAGALRKAFPDYQAKDLLETGLVVDNEEGRRYDRFRDRIMFPIQDIRGNVIGFGGRVLGQGEPKYLNSPETPLFEKGRELYGLPQARPGIRQSGTAVVVEGYMDVVALAQFGVTNAVATLGTATTPMHVHKLLRAAERVVFCFDGDLAGRRAAWRALESSLESLVDNKPLSFLFLPEEHDPDSFVRAHGADAFRAAAAGATPLAEFMLQHLRSDCDLATAEGRARLVFNAKELVLKVAAPVLRLQILKAVAEAGGLTQEELEQTYGIRSAPRSFRPSRAAAHPRAEPVKALPGPVHTLLRLVIQRPAWAARLRVDSIPPDTPEAQALVAIVDAVEVGDIGNDYPLGSLIEHFRDTPVAETLAQIAAGALQAPADDEVAETLFRDSLSKLQTRSLEQQITALIDKGRRTALTEDERQRLAHLLLQKSQSKASAKPADM